MRRRHLLVAALLGGAASACSAEDESDATVSHGSQALPSPATTAAGGLAAALGARRSLREYAAQRLTEDEVGQLMWAAQGVTSPDGLRTAPSAGALYPLTVSVALPEGLRRYHPVGHRVEHVSSRDVRAPLAEAAVGQTWIAAAPAVFAITGNIARTAAKYGDRAERYVHLEAGHAAQNLLLQATALGLGGVSVGAFDDDRVRELVDLDDELPLYVLPVGHPRG
jgi:SagB-type dehydrogenase family enzyme